MYLLTCIFMILNGWWDPRKGLTKALLLGVLKWLIKSRCSLPHLTTWVLSLETTWQKNRIDSCKCPLISAHEQWHIDPSTYAHVHIQNKNKEMYTREKKRNPCYPPSHLACYLGFWTSDCWSHIRSQSGQQVGNGKGEEASFIRGKLSSSIFSLKTFYS